MNRGCAIVKNDAASPDADIEYPESNLIIEVDISPSSVLVLSSRYPVFVSLLQQ